MHPELQRLKSNFNWRPALTTNTTIKNLFEIASESDVKSAYSDAHTIERSLLDSRSWWYQTRNKIITRALTQLPNQSAVWDIGCGTGIVASAILQSGRQVIGIEPSYAGAQITAAAGIPTFHATLEKLELPSNALSVVSLFDVLEHVQERQHILNELHRVLEPDGFVILTVPALPLLWSQYDCDESHLLRFTKSALEIELKNAGFRVKQMGYFFVLTVIPLLLLRALPYRLGFNKFLSDSAGVSAQGGLLSGLAASLETALATRVPIGSSLLAVAQKTKTF